MNYKSVTLNFLSEEYKEVFKEALKQVADMYDSRNKQSGLSEPYKNLIKDLENTRFETCAGHLECAYYAIKHYKTDDKKKKAIAYSLNALITTTQLNQEIQKLELNDKEMKEIKTLYAKHKKYNK